MTLRPFGVRSLIGAVGLVAMAALPVAAALAAGRGLPTLAPVVPAVEVLRGLGRWLAQAWSGWSAGLSLAAAGAALAAMVRWALARNGRWSEVPVWMLGGAALVVASAAGAVGRWPVAAAVVVLLPVLAARRAVASPSLREPGWSRQLTLAVLVLAALLRFVDLADHPAGFGTHGIVHLGMSVDLVDRVLEGPGALDRPFSPKAFLTEQHGPMAVVNALGFALFGVGLVQARLTQALLGVITVWLGVQLGRRLGDARVGLVLGFLLAVSPWHVTISRFNDAEHVLAPLQALLAFWAVLHADRVRTPAAFAAAGLACALGWYVYATNQVLLLAQLAFVAWRTVLVRGALRRHWLGLTAFVVVFAAASLPHLLTGVHEGRPLPIRSGYQLGGQGLYAVTGLAKLPANLQAAAESLYLRADDPWYTKPSGGGLDPLLALLLPAGLAWCLLALGRRERRSRGALLLLWAAAGLLPAVLLAQVEFRRLLQVELAAEVMAALVLVELAALAATRWGRRTLRVAVPVAAVVWTCVATSICWDRVDVPESRSSTYWVELVKDLRDRLGREPVVVVLAAKGELGPEHHDALRIGLHDRVRELARAGTPLAGAIRTVPAAELPGAVEALAEGCRSVRVVSAWGLADAELERVVRGLDPEARRERIDDALGQPTLAAWTVAVPAGGLRRPAGGAAGRPRVPPG